MKYTDNHDPHDVTSTPDNGGWFTSGWGKNEWLIWLRACIAADQKTRWLDYWNDQSWYDTDKEFDFYDTDFYNEVKAAFPDMSENYVSEGSNLVKKVTDTASNVVDTVKNASKALSNTSDALKYILPAAAIAIIIIVLVKVNNSKAI